MRNITGIVQQGMCCGCGACINVCNHKALKYTNDKYGFLVPYIDPGLCVDCGRCYKTCPSVESIDALPQIAYAAMNKKETERFKASSGGIFGAIAESVLREHGAVYGAKMNDKFQVIHSVAENVDSLQPLLKSKYVQSYMGDIYKDVLERLKNGQKILFSGTPCQVSAIKNFVPPKYRDGLYLIDVVCHGVPSQQFFDSYIAHLSEREGKVKHYQFRAKKKVDNGMNWFFEYETEQKKNRIKNWPEDTYNYLYMQSYINRESCYGCKYAKESRPGDITLCDYWNWPEYHSEFPVGSTVSGVLLNTDKGKALFNSITEDLYYIETSLNNIKINNSCLVKPANKPKLRDQLLNKWLDGGFDVLDREYRSKNKKAILKYKIMSAIPISILNKLVNIRMAIKRR